jgi:stromal interaction molecule 1
MGIRDPRHKQKLTLKATDVVLFGPPKEYSNRLRETILTASLAIALTVIWVVYRRYQNSQRELNKMSKEIDGLAEAEKALKTLQEELSRTSEDIMTNGVQDKNGNSQDQKEEVEMLKAEVQYLKTRLEDAEHEIQDKCWLPPPNLRYYLQQTYEIETRAYNHKKNSAERQLRQAREACNKLKEKKSSLIHAFVAANSKAVDEVDKAIVEAKTSLQEVTAELRERMHRWKEIESLANFKIVNNPSARTLESIGRTLAMGSIGRTSSGASIRSGSRPSSLLHDSQESLLE